MCGMPMLGLELLDGGAIAVAVDERGRVQARGSVDAAGDTSAVGWVVTPWAQTVTKR